MLVIAGLVGELREPAGAVGDVEGLAVELDLVDLGLAGEQGEDRRGGLAVAEAPEGAADPLVREGREEVLEVEVEHDVGPHVGARVAHDRALLAEAVRGVVQGDLVEEVVEDPALGVLEARHRRRDPPRAAGLLGISNRT